MSIIISKAGERAVRVDKTQIERESFLQKYILTNPETLPLYELDENIKLLIIAREFPTGSGPIDAIGVDQYGSIYIIETKLFTNADKRLVVAQVLDYGASLWSLRSESSQFLGALEKKSQEHFGVSLQIKFIEFFEMEEEEAISAIDAIGRNLSEAKFRFIVMMDELHDRLKDLVFYLNANSNFEFYVVSVEYYKHLDSEIMIPKLHGVETSRSKRTAGKERGTLWNESSFFDEIRKHLTNDQQQLVKKLYQATARVGTIGWAEGITPAFYGVFPSFTDQLAVYKVKGDGSIRILFSQLNTDAATEKIRDDIKDGLKNILNIPHDYAVRRPGYGIDEWGPVSDNFIKVLETIVK